MTNPMNRLNFTLENGLIVQIQDTLIKNHLNQEYSEINIGKNGKYLISSHGICFDNAKSTSFFRLSRVAAISNAANIIRNKIYSEKGLSKRNPKDIDKVESFLIQDERFLAFKAIEKALNEIYKKEDCKE